IPLGLLQTPQCFYDPDVFQHALYSEKRAPNEQDFFYRTIEVAKTSTNSVIYGGSNTMIARQALEDIGGFYTESITEDFATGLLIESAGYVSLGLGEPLASGQTPHTFKEHIQQRTRWGRGVIVTAKKLHLFTRKGLSFMQRINYWSSEVYWYSPIKNIIYMLSPLLYAVFNVPVFYCNWLELLVFWFPMFLFQDLCLRFISGNRVSSKWSGIYEASVMPHLFIPIIKEALGITLSAFKVTDKSGVSKYRQRDLRSMIPFIVLSVLSVLGIIRIVYLLSRHLELGLFILLFWTVRNLYYLIMAIFLVDGRDSDGEAVKVIDTELVRVTTPDQKIFEGVTTLMTEHSVSVYLDESEGLKIGDSVSLNIESDQYDATVRGIVIGINYSRSGSRSVHTIEILDFGSDAEAYQQILFDRIPTLPQSLTRDFGILPHLWINIAHRVARSAH
ncbi:MAG: glycosyltransferase family 2 protein, partial [bacterium]